jgi:hypothetical protein
MDRRYESNRKEKTADCEIEGLFDGIMDVYNINLVPANDVKQLVQPDRHAEDGISLSKRQLGLRAKEVN